MFDLVLLAAREGFLQDMILPGVVGGVVMVWIINSVLKKWGYYLF